MLQDDLSRTCPHGYLSLFLPTMEEGLVTTVVLDPEGCTRINGLGEAIEVEEAEII